MTIKEFIQLFANEFDSIDVDKLEPDTYFREIPEWSSILTLSVITMIEEEFDVKITLHEFQKFNTIRDLYNGILNHVEV